MYGYNYKILFFYNQKLLNCLGVTNMKVLFCYEIIIKDMKFYYSRNMFG